jgi:phage baseplate assembly protein W
LAAIKHINEINVRNKIDTELYSDFYSNFESHPDKLDLIKYSNEESVKRSIKNILQTNTGERFFNPVFGSDIRKLLFELASPVTESLLREYIEVAITNFEPRARVLDVVVSTNGDETGYNVSVIFSTINTTEPVTLSLILSRIR